MSADWLVQTFFEAGSVGALAVQGATGLTVGLLLLLALFSEGPRLRAWARDQPTQAAVVAGAMALGLLIRLGLPTGPMDIYSRLESATAPMARAESLYGLAFPTVVRLLWAVTGPSDGSVFALNTGIGVLTIGAVHALSLRLHPSRSAAAIAAVAVAASPVLAHFSRTDIQTVLEVGLTAWGLTALLREPEWRSALTAGLALGLASTLRPEAGVVLGVAATALWACGRRPHRADLGWAAGLGVVLPSGLATLGLALSGTQTHAFASTHAFDQGILHPLFLDPSWTPIWVTAGLFLLPFAREPSARIRGWVAAWLVLFTWLVWGFSPEHMHLAGMRHQLRAMPFLALAAGFGLAPALAAIADRRGTAAGLAVVVVGSTALAFREVRQSPTALLEYRFVRDHIAEIPAGCWVVSHLNPQGRDASLLPPWRLSDQAGLGHRWVDLDVDSLPREGCAVYYRGSNCWARVAGERVPSLAEWRPHRPCLATEAILAVEPLATVTLPTRPFGTDFYPEGATVEVGFFEIPGRTDQPPPGIETPPAPPRRVTAIQRPPPGRPAAARPRPEPRRQPPPAAGPQPPVPADWPADAVREALVADPHCRPERTDCEGGVCLILSRSPTCSQDHCGEAAEEGVDYDTTRMAWLDDTGAGTVVCGLVPADDAGAHMDHANRRAAVLLHATVP